MSESERQAQMSETASPTRWRRLFDAADRALELAPEERAAFISECSGDDPDFGAALEAFLVGAEKATALEVPAAQLAAGLFDDRLGEPVGLAPPETRFGPYRVLREIG